MALMALAAPGATWFSNHPLADRWLSGTTRDWSIAAAVFLVSVNLAAVGALVLASGLGVLRPWRDSRGRWAAVLVMVAANCAIPVIGFSLVQEDAAVTSLGDAWVALAATWRLPCIVAILRLFRRSQQWEALSADEALRRDPRAPVVYLRAFTDDGQMAVPGHALVGPRLRQGRERADADQPRTGAGVHPPARRSGDRDRQARGAAARTGCRAPVCRLTSDGSKTVLEMLERSSLVLARVGSSPGVLWELDQVLTRVERAKVLLLVLGSADAIRMRDCSRDRGARRANQSTSPPPPTSRWRRLLALLSADPHRPIGVLVGFDDAGRVKADAIPDIAYGPGDLARTLMMRPFAGSLRATARKLFARQGREWREPPSRVVAVTLALFAGGFGAHWFYLKSHRRAVKRLLLLPVIWLTLPFAWYEACRWLLADRREFEDSVAVGPGWHKHCFVPSREAFSLAGLSPRGDGLRRVGHRSDGRPERAVHSGRRRHGLHRYIAHQTGVRRGVGRLAMSGRRPLHSRR